MQPCAEACHGGVTLRLSTMTCRAAYFRNARLAAEEAVQNRDLRSEVVHPGRPACARGHGHGGADEGLLLFKGAHFKSLTRGTTDTPLREAVYAAIGCRVHVANKASGS